MLLTLTAFLAMIGLLSALILVRRRAAGRRTDAKAVPPNFGRDIQTGKVLPLPEDLAAALEQAADQRRMARDELVSAILCSWDQLDEDAKAVIILSFLVSGDM